VSEAQETSPKIGRPSLYSIELAATVCDRISGGESLRKVCRDESMPCTATVMKWAREIPEFTELYAKAREMLLEHWSEEITEIADDGSNDWVASVDPENPGYRLNGEHINRSRLRVDTRKWLLSKLAARKYGDRIATELSGPNGGPIETADVTDIEAARRMAFILAKGMRAQEGEK
jgi:hypothetical protein